MEKGSFRSTVQGTPGTQLTHLGIKISESKLGFNPGVSYSSFRLFLSRCQNCDTDLTNQKLKVSLV